MSRTFLCTMTSAGNEANLRAMIEPVAPLQYMANDACNEAMFSPVRL